MATLGFWDAARLAGVSRQHLYKMAEAGEVSVVKELLPGRTVRADRMLTPGHFSVSGNNAYSGLFPYLKNTFIMK